MFQLAKDTNIKPFASTDEDLNEFLLKLAKPYQNRLLATTHIIENSEKTIAFFSILNDTLFVDQHNFISKNQARKFISSKLPSQKRHIKSFPAIKIGRLAVCKQEKGYGRIIINWILDYAINCNKKSACKFITVDAYKESLGFYEKMNFSYLSEMDANKDTRQMYLDLTPYINSIEEL